MWCSGNILLSHIHTFSLPATCPTPLPVPHCPLPGIIPWLLLQASPQGGTHPSHFHNTPDIVVPRGSWTDNDLFLHFSPIASAVPNHCGCFTLNHGESSIYPYSPLLPLFSGSEKSQGMLALCISPNRRYLAVSEMVQEKPVITIYELSSIPVRKRKILSNFDFPVQRFTCMAFSPDSKYLLTQTSPPESNLVYWLWEKQKVMAIVRIDSQNNGVYQVPPSITSVVQIRNNSKRCLLLNVFYVPRAVLISEHAFLNLVSQQPYIVCVIIIPILQMKLQEVQITE